MAEVFGDRHSNADGNFERRLAGWAIKAYIPTTLAAIDGHHYLCSAWRNVEVFSQHDPVATDLRKRNNCVADQKGQSDVSRISMIGGKLTHGRSIFKIAGECEPLL